MAERESGTRVSDDRLEALEMTIADQQRVIDDLNETVTRQWAVLKEFEREIGKLSGQIEQLEQTAPMPDAERPPHY